MADQTISSTSTTNNSAKFAVIDNIRWQEPAIGSIVRGYLPDQEWVILRGVTTEQLIVAAAAGKVAFSGKIKGYGNVVVVKHDNGYFTTYANNQKNFVKAGDSVAQGQQIAQMGTNASKQPELRFMLTKHGDPVNAALLFLRG